MMRSPSLITLLFFGSGILLSRFISPPLVFLFPALTLLLLFSILLKEKHFANPILFVGLILSGLLYHEVRTKFLPLHHLSRLPIYGGQVSLKGRIVSEPIFRSQPSDRQDSIMEGERISFVCKGESLYFRERRIPIQGKVEITVTDPRETLQYGDIILVQGEMTKPPGLRNPGGFNYRAYLAREGIYGILKVKEGEIKILDCEKGFFLIQRLILPVKHYIRKTFRETLSGDPLGLLLGITIGEREAVSRRVKRSFQDTGVIHVLAISGFNVGIVGFVFFGLFRALQIPYNLSLIFTSLFLIGYAILTGLETPVVRATLMSLCITGGLLSEREMNLLNLLAFAGLLILLSNPDFLFDVGTQLSFAATFSIIYMVEKFHKIFPILKNRSILSRWILLPLAVSTSAQLGVTPLVAYYFHLLPLASLLGNLVVIPLVSYSIAIGFTTIFTNLFSLTLTKLFSEANWLALTGTLRSVDLLSSLPFASFHVKSPSVLFILFYYLFLLFIFQVRKSQKVRKGLVFLILIGLNLSVWTNLFRKSSLEITFLDVGQGDATFLKFPNGRTILIDGGDRYEEFDAGERVVAPFLWSKGIRRIDLLLLTHPHKDHMGGLPYILDHFSIGTFMDSGIPYPSRDYLGLLEKIKQKGIPYKRVAKGDRISGLGYPIQILHPTDEILWMGERDQDFNPNDGSVVIQFEVDEKVFLFPGDIQEEAETLTRLGKRSTVLKVPHQGSKASNPLPFISHFSPEITVISCGFKNSFGFPHQEVLDGYEKVGSRIYRTDLDGAVILKIVGEKLEVTTIIPHSLPLDGGE